MRFLVTGLPRSRTAWLASFLRCPHEPLTYCATLDDLGRIAGTGGCCDTVALLLWKRIRAKWPSARFVVVRRNPKEVRASLRAIGLPASYLGAALQSLDEACTTAVSPALVVDYGDLNDRLPEIWQWCWGTPMRDCADALKHCRITCDHNELLSRLDPARLKSLMES